MPELASVNGVVTPLADAQVPLLDRGVLFGDAIYEVIRFYNGRPFCLDDHLERLCNSAKGLRFDASLDTERLGGQGLALFEQSGLVDGRLYYQISRGVGSSRSYLPEPMLRPTEIIVAESIRPPSDQLYAQGVSVVTAREIRWSRTDLKTTNLIPRILVRLDAQTDGAYEALWVDDNHYVLEGTSSNVFAVFGKTLRTPPTGSGLLAGVTRKIVIEQALAEGFPVEEYPISLEELAQADEVFLTATTPEILGIVRVNHRVVGSGVVGPITKTLLLSYRQRVARGT